MQVKSRMCKFNVQCCPSTFEGHCRSAFVSLSSLSLSLPSPTLLHAGSYLSEDEVLDRVNPFVQLVSGVVWLLRSGEVYINESLQAECAKSEETGTSVFSTAPDWCNSSELWELNF